MARQTLTPVILCGGSGTRLWPRSRPELPKPFLPLVGERTLFQQALQRCADAQLFDPPLIVTGAAHVGLVEEQSRGVAIREVIVEPQPRQTAAAVALAALRLNEDAVMLVCPSDHHMDGGEQFKAAAAAAARLAAEGLLVCLTIPASAPDTRFGYVRKGDPLGTAGFRVAQFVEKPDRERALAYVASGDFAWNAGIFAFRAGDYLRELERFRPRLADAVRRSVAAGTAVAGRFRPDEAAFAEIEPESIDYAVMENSDRSAMVMARMAWSDVGSWEALHEMRAKDERGNSVRGPAELVDCRNLLIETDGPRVRAVGLENIVIIVDGSDILVTKSAGGGAKDPGGRS